MRACIESERADKDGMSFITSSFSPLILSTVIRLKKLGVRGGERLAEADLDSFLLEVSNKIWKLPIKPIRQYWNSNLMRKLNSILGSFMRQG